MRFQTKLMLRKAAILSCTVLVGFAVLTFAMDSRSRADAPADTASAPAATRFHGAFVDPFDSPSASGLTLEDALRISRLTPELPSEAVVGKVRKVALNETVEDARGRCGFMVLYESGVRLSVEPGATDVADRVKQPSGVSPFRDGRRTVFDLSQVAGRPAMVRQPGEQMAQSAEIHLPALLLWSQDGLTYELAGGMPYAVNGDSSYGVSSASALGEVAMGDLMKAAESFDRRP